MLRIKLVKSTIGCEKRNRATVAALGLRKLNQAVELPDSPSVRGMVRHVARLLAVEVIEGEAPAKARKDGQANAKATKVVARAVEKPDAEARAEVAEKKAPKPKAATKTRAEAKKPDAAKAKPVAKKSAAIKAKAKK